MLVTRKSELSGVVRTADLDVTQEQLDEMAKPPQLRRLLQDIFPQLSVENREFVKTGITAEEWDALFRNDE